uniref:Uncharacterized protein n=1 Tax=Parascaris equorum TaxID=6256 RepID=A0A914S6B9_PAREQ
MLVNRTPIQQFQDKHVPPKSSDGMLLVRDGGADTNQGLLHGVISEGNSELKEHRRAARSKVGSFCVEEHRFLCKCLYNLVTICSAGDDVFKTQASKQSVNIALV